MLFVYARHLRSIQQTLLVPFLVSTSLSADEQQYIPVLGEEEFLSSIVATRLYLL